MQVFGLYEQLITQVLAAGLQGKRLYVGERALAPAQASAQLAQFLSRVLTFALESVSVPDPEPRARLSAQIQLANRLILWLQQQIEEDEDFFADNLIDTQGRMLTALYATDNPIAADFPKYVSDIYPGGFKPEVQRWQV